MSASRLPHAYAFECYGVSVAVHTNRASELPRVSGIINAALPVPHTPTDPGRAEHHIRYRFDRSGNDSLHGGPSGESLLDIPRESALGLLESWVRLKVAEFAPSHVFIHAGVVGWKGKAIIVPGTSYSGKTSLTVEMIRRGATYYSDEYAVIDENGFVTPFPKSLSIRGEVNAYTQVEHPVETFGAAVGTQRIPISMVVITKYVPNGRWRPKILTPSAGIMELLKNTVSARTNPVFVLSVLTKVSERARFVRSYRGEAEKTADRLISLVSQ